MKRWIVFCLLVVLTHLITTAQNIRRFRQFDINQGLAHTDATALTEDENGYIWIGTNAGLQRFDGRQTLLFINSISKINQVYNNRITSLCSSGHHLWIGSEGGLHLFDLRKQKHIQLKYKGINFDANPQVVDEIITFENKIWIISNNELFCGKLDSADNQLEIQNFDEIVVSTPEYFRNSNKISIATNGTNMLWVGTNRGLASFQKAGNDLILSEILRNEDSAKEGLASNYVNHIKFEENVLWIIAQPYFQIFSLTNENSKFRGVLKTIDLNEIFEGTEFENDNRSYNDFIIDKDFNFWCATSNGLVFIEEPISQNYSFQLFNKSPYDPFSISSNNVSGVLLDHSNCLWASTWAGGLSYLDLGQKQFNLLIKDPSKINQSLSEPFVRAITQDNTGRIWIGGQNEGIDFYLPETGECYPFRIGNIDNLDLTSTKIRSLKYHNNKVYIGTTQGLNIIDLKSERLFKFPNIVADKSPIYTIEFDKFGFVWLGTWKSGIYRLTFSGNVLEEVVNYGEKKEGPHYLSSLQVNYLYSDYTKNEILAGTKKGLNRIILGDDGTVNNIVYYRCNSSEHSLGSEYVWPIEKESDTVYWVGTLGGGLNRIVLLNGWDENNMGLYEAKAYTVSEGAPSNDIESMLKDNQGRLWLGSKGLSVFDVQKREFWNFDVNDGLQSNGFKIGSSFKNKDGILFFGGINGMNHFNPDDIKRNEIKPKIVLNGLQIRNKEVLPGQEHGRKVVLESGLSYTNEIVLNYKENDFNLSFASLHYANPEKCSYKYLLDGYDEDWHYISGEYPVASYSNLQYGDYTFIVDATNGDGIWSENPVELQISITPPWWQSSWAYFGYVLLFLAVGTGVLYYTNRWMKLRNELKLVEAEEAKKEELHQMKLQFFMNISHEFKTPLTLILTPLEKLRSSELSNPEKNKMLQLISDNARRMHNLIDDLMEFRKAEVGHLCLHAANTGIVSFVQDIYQQFIPLCQKGQIAYSFSADQVGDVWFDSKKMSTILYNLLANAINNTEEGGNVELKIIQSKHSDLQLTYENSFIVSNELTNKEYVYIRVTDTGVGISKKSIEQIFDRFYHMGTSKNKHLGTGIGLALLKNLVLLHHGHVIVSSERFKGTEFLVGLPVGKDHLRVEEVADESPDKLQINLERIDNVNSMNKVDLSNTAIEELKNLPMLLLVEDNQELRGVLYDHFSMEYKVIEAENGLEALQKIEDKNIDLVISDIMMPEMDGLELIRELREDIKTSHLPIALLTAKSTIEDQISGIEAGADMYFPKPFNLKLMDLKIKKFLDSRKVLMEKYASNVFADSRELVRTQKDKDFLEKFVGLVDENIDNSDFSIEKICLELSIGRTNLYKKIRSLTGQSMGEFIRGLRLKKAAKILITEDVSISEVLYRVGINSNSYFTKSFKAQFGMTPTEFINQNVGKYN